MGPTWRLRTNLLAAPQTDDGQQKMWHLPAGTRPFSFAAASDAHKAIVWVWVARLGSVSVDATATFRPAPILPNEPERHTG